MDDGKFTNLHQACLNSLHYLYRESQQTLDLLTVAARSPSDTETRNHLESQIDQEDRARLDYQGRRRELIVLVTLT